MKDQLYDVINSRKFVINDYLIKCALSFGLNLNEFLIIVYFDNNKDSFDLDRVSLELGLSSDEVMNAFNSLMVKGIITLDSTKDIDGRMMEVVNLDGLYSLIIDDFKVKEKNECKDSVFSTFELEFGRPLSPVDLESINKWLSDGISSELIIGALREASYNGVLTIRYIDGILYKWVKKGFKSMEEVEAYTKNRRDEIHSDKEITKKEQDISEYNWLV